MSRINLTPSANPAACWLLILFLAGCGGGGAGSNVDSQSDAPFSKTYIASAAAGEVINYTFNSVNRTYSYQVVKSAYSISAGTTGGGTLTANGDGSWAPSESPASKVYAVANGGIVGGVRINLSGTNREVPIYGIADPLTQVTDFAGTYNYVSLQCSIKNSGLFTGCDTDYGTLVITATSVSTGTYQMCVKGYPSKPVACASTANGAVSASGVSGLWKFTNSATSLDSYLMVHTGSNGQRVGLLDFDDLGGHGFGQAVLAQLATVSASQIGGTYVYQATLPNEVSQKTGTFSFDASSSTTRAGLTFALNEPWNGMAKAGANGYAIFTGGGVYAYRNPSVASGFYELGVKRSY